MVVVENDKLRWKIEEKRIEMKTMANKKGFQNKQVIQCSQELDELIRVYQELLLTKLKG